MMKNRFRAMILCAAMLLSLAAGLSGCGEKGDIGPADVTEGLVREDLPNGALWYNKDEKYADIVKTTRGEFENDSIPVLFMVATDDDVIAIAGLNSTERDKVTNVNAYTTYEIGSVTKMFTATAILQLAEQGKLSLDDRLGKYFPEYEYGAGITLYQMLHMQSGIFDYVNEGDAFLHKFDTQMKIYSDSLPDSELLADIFTHELKFEPGSKFDYSNTNYLLLAMIIEQLTGSSYGEYIQKNIFDVCGMEHSSSMKTGDVTSVPEIGTYTSSTYFDRGAGDIHTCAADLVAFDRALHGGRLLSKNSLREMFRMDMGYGCGWEELPGAPDCHYHGGNIGSYLACNTVFDTEKYGRVYYVQFFPKCDFSGETAEYMDHGIESIKAVLENGYTDDPEQSREERRSGNACVGDIIEFGDYKGHTTWRVLDVNGPEVLMVTEDIVDKQIFDTYLSSWDSGYCSLRRWLNDTYINEAFTDRERELICEKNGDEVFLLSVEEAWRYFEDDLDRYLRTGDNDGWWLRSEGAYPDHAAFVDSDHKFRGNIDVQGGLVYCERGVRPAVWVRLNQASEADAANIEDVSESGYFTLLRSGSETWLTGLTEEGMEQEDLTVPADVKIFGNITGGTVKNIAFESDDDIDYGYFFAKSKKLETVKLPSKLTKLGPFSFCPRLKEIVIPEGVTEIPVYCFCEDTMLEEVKIMGNLNEIGNFAFAGCKSLKTVVLPDSVQTVCYGVFNGCSSLKEIVLPKGLKELGDRVFVDSGLETVIVPEELELEIWGNGTFDLLNNTCTVKVKAGSWADEHFGEVFTGNTIKIYY